MDVPEEKEEELEVQFVPHFNNRFLFNEQTGGIVCVVVEVGTRMLMALQASRTRIACSAPKFAFVPKPLSESSARCPVEAFEGFPCSIRAMYTAIHQAILFHERQVRTHPKNATSPHSFQERMRQQAHASGSGTLGGAGGGGLSRQRSGSDSGFDIINLPIPDTSGDEALARRLAEEENKRASTAAAAAAGASIGGSPSGSSVHASHPEYRHRVAFTGSSDILTDTQLQQLLHSIPRRYQLKEWVRVFR